MSRAETGDSQKNSGENENKICPFCGARFAESVKTCPSHGVALEDMGGNELLGAVLLDGRYRIASYVASGGWGAVYRGIDLQSQTPVAIKILHPHLAEDETQLKRFEREIEVVRSLDHRCIAKIFANGFIGHSQPFVVMEHVDGTALDRVLKAEDHLPVARCAQIFGQASNALAAAHARDIVHRDIKPANMMLLKDNGVKLLDFGLSQVTSADPGQNHRLSKTGEMHGSVQYMSPEQFKGEKLDGRSDLYSLGCVLYEALTGVKVCPRVAPFECMVRHLQEPIPSVQDVRADLKIPDAMNEIVVKALAKSRSDRFQTAEEFEQALAGCSAGGKEKSGGFWQKLLGRK